MSWALMAPERKCIELTVFRAYSTVLSIICSVVSIGTVPKACYNINESRETYSKEMEKILGIDTCLKFTIRPVGGVEIKK